MVYIKGNPSDKLILREKIMFSALELFSKDGIKSVTMDMIASSLGISKRTLYEVFEDKETLLRECILNRLRERDLYLKSVMENAKTVLDVIFAWYRSNIEMYMNSGPKFFDDLNQYPRVHREVDKNRKKDEQNGLDFLMKGVGQGIFRSEVNFAIFIKMGHELMHALMRSQQLHVYSFFDVYESVVVTFLRGISTSQGVQLIDEFINEYRKTYRKQSPNIKKL